MYRFLLNSFELEVAQMLPMDDGEVYLCKIRNVLIEEFLKDDTRSLEERISQIAPAHTTCQTYFGWDGKTIGPWGGLKDKF